MDRVNVASCCVGGCGRLTRKCSKSEHLVLYMNYTDKNWCCADGCGKVTETWYIIKYHYSQGTCIEGHQRLLLWWCVWTSDKIMQWYWTHTTIHELDRCILLLCGWELRRKADMLYWRLPVTCNRFLLATNTSRRASSTQKHEAPLVEGTLARGR